MVVPEAVKLARRAHRTIRWNLVWAFGYNVAALPLAVTGLLSPLICGCGDVTVVGFSRTGALWAKNRKI